VSLQVIRKRRYGRKLKTRQAALGGNRWLGVRRVYWHHKIYPFDDDPDRNPWTRPSVVLKRTQKSVFWGLFACGSLR
jgi:hypothetical protein